MDSRHRPRPRAGDLACSVCREPVSPDRRRLLARREDIAFVELSCQACASVTLGFVFDSDGPEVDEVRVHEPPTVSADDVLEMHAVLEAWDGDLRTLLEGSRRPREQRGDR